MKPKIAKVFHDNELEITIDVNKFEVDYLDVHLNITNGEYSPFIKPNNVPLYVHVQLNQPPCVIKAIPKGVQDRLSKISSNEKVFNVAGKKYQEALNTAGHTHILKYKPSMGPVTSDILILNRLCPSKGAE